ncbi:MAG: hypothetical protein IIU45_07075 [Lachnospiraceae bacterium]|jgi:hypothetical protein|nr:hypothetical protein [Lachnospiraceae bacterium]MCR5319926.1 hypothetical protein [Lachnospiraceae bacterium]
MKQKRVKVSTKIMQVKVLHTVLMLVWPFAATGLLLLLFIFFGTRHLQPSILVLGLALMSLYSIYRALVLLRNLDLQSIIVDDCDFDAYIECMKFLEKFYIYYRAGLYPRVFSTDAYLLKGDFATAYSHLMGMWNEVQKAHGTTRMMYDYFWCRFYGEVEDAENFEICMKHFRETWLENVNLGALLRRQGYMLEMELNFREMMLTGQYVKAIDFLTKLYKQGRLNTRYEFYKYCYFMGRNEFALSHFGKAKHWFAQTVSFGLQEHMGNAAKAYLDKLEEWGVPYDPQVPENNTPYGRY